MKSIFPAAALLVAFSFPAFGQLTPVANNLAYSVAAGAPLTVPTNSGVLAYAYDPSGHTITASLDNAPTNGTVALNANGSFVYTPNTGFAGYDYFTYSVSDTNLASASATVTLDVGNERWDDQFSASSFGHEVAAISVATNGDIYAAGLMPGGIARWDGRVWSKLGNRLLNGVSGSIDALGWQHNVLIVGGSFTKAGGRPAENLAQWDGTTWSAFHGGVDGPVQAVCIASNFVYVGGQFTNAGNQRVSNIAFWDGTNWFDLDGGVNGPVTAMIADTNGDLYLAGAFTTAGGIIANGIALWRGGSWLPLNSGVSGSIKSLLLQNGQLYAGGTFNKIGGITATNIARWDGTNWSALGNGAPGGPVNSLAFHDGQLYAGQSAPPGSFNPAQVLQWNGANWTPLPSMINPQGAAGIFSLAFENDTLLAGGLFTSGGSAVVDNIAAWDGQAWTAVNNAIGGNDVFAVATQGANVYLGGDFTSAVGTRVGAIIRWDGSHWWPLGNGSSNGVNQTVYALAADASGLLYVGGNFSQAGGISVNNIAQWDGTNWAPLGFGTTNGLNGAVYSLVVDSAGHLVVGGSFNQAGGLPAANIARWDGQKWSALDSGLNGQALALAVSGSDLFVGGAFTSAGGVSVHNIARWDGSRWSALGHGLGSFQTAVHTMAVRGPKLFAGAEITGGSSPPWVAQWDGSTWTTIATNLSMPGNVVGINALSVVGNDLYAAGLFTAINSLNTSSIARWDGTNWYPLGTGVAGDSPTVYSLASQNGELLVGGSFSIAGVNSSTLFSRWKLPDAPPTIAITAPSPNSTFIVGADIELDVNAGAGGSPLSQVAYYAGPMLLGASATPPYSFVWSNVFTGNYTLYAAATDASGQTTISGPVPIYVVPPSNDIPPSVAFISPTNNNLFTNGENISLRVNATDSDGTVREVAFYDNSTFIGLVTNSPYALSWSSQDPGNHILQAVAMDNLGATNSASVQIDLESPPVVYIDQPADGARFIAPSYIYLEANANIDVGSIARVDFYTNGAFFVSANIAQSPEYAYRWSNPPLGNYSLTAIAVDGHGFAASSIPVQIAVVESNTPLISISTPTNGAVYSAPTNILVSVAVSDVNPIQSVQLYNNSILVGTLTNAPYVFVLRNLAQTAYNFVAHTLDNQGYTAASFPVSVNVTNDPSREPLFNLTDIGSLLGPANQALGINANGFVVGASTTPTSSYQPFFDNGAVQWLPLLGGKSLGGGGAATGINNSNLITGNAATGSGYGHAFRFDGTNIVDLGAFGGQQSSGAAINASGEIVGSADDANNQSRAFLYTNGEMINLDTFGGASSVATAINTGGQVVGYASFPPNNILGFLYTPGASNQILGNLGGPVCQPHAINDAGQIAGDAGISADYSHAFLSLQGFMVDLGTLGGFNSAALGMNNYGQIVGWSENDQLQSRAFLWQNDVMYDLNELIPTNSGWILQQATAINDAGQIVGYGLHGADQNDQAFLLTLATNSPVQPQDAQLLDCISEQFNLNLPVPRGRPFVLQASPDLRNWTSVATNYDRTGLVNFTDAHATANAVRFYRVAPLH